MNDPRISDRMPGDEVVVHYRAASGVVDEAPAAEVRAAVLAAAARAVQARPHGADAARPGDARPKLHMRLPLAAAATLVLSSIAVLLATRVEEQVRAPSAPAQDEARIAARAPAADVRASDVPTSDVPTQKSPTEATRKTAVAANRTPPRTQQAPRTDAAAHQRRQNAVSAPAPRPVGESTSVDRADADTSAAPSGIRARESSAAAAKAATASAAAERAGDAAAQRAEEADPAHWIERITRLRTQGRDAEADEEIRRFRERHPQIALPPAALRPTGPP